MSTLYDSIANPNIAPKRYSPFWFRFLEILPGVTVWAALILPFALAIYYPLQVTIFIIVFDIYWLQKALDSAAVLYIAYRKMRKQVTTDWSSKLQQLHLLSTDEKRQQHVLDPEIIYQAVILPTYKEEEAILEASIRSICEADFPPERVFVILATENRDAQNVRPIAESLIKKFHNSFFRFIVTEHPDIVGEVKAKGANASWAAKELARQAQQLEIAFDHIVVSTADADTRFHPLYFACLSYFFATNPKRVHCSYQPVPTYLNNVWEASMISRVMAYGTTFWGMVESVRDYRMLTFSTHAMSLKTLVDINYWSTSIVNEDSRQFFRAYFHYKGNFKAIPLFMPVYMDAVHLGTVWDTWKNLYLQQRRWAYGVEHFPYIVLESLRQRTIPVLDRILLVYRAFHGTFFWSTTAFFISVVGWLPIALNNSFRDQVIASNFPRVTSWLLTLAWIGVFISNFISLQMLPARKDKKGYHFIPMIVQWFLVPPCTIFLGAFPGIDAQTRLMLGKYMGFRVTEKKAVGAGTTPLPARG